MGQALELISSNILILEKREARPEGIQYSYRIDPGVHKLYGVTFLRSFLSMTSWYFLVPCTGSLARSWSFGYPVYFCHCVCIQGQAVWKKEKKNRGWFYSFGNTIVLERKGHLPEFWLLQVPTTSSWCCHHHGLLGGWRVREHRKEKPKGFPHSEYCKLPFYSLGQN